AKVKKLAVSRRERFLSETETARLLQAISSMQASGTLSQTFADAFLLLLFTGARKSEIAKLAWDEVDPERGLIRLPPPRAKTGVKPAAKPIVLSAPAARVIAARPRIGRFVFPSARSSDKPIVGLQKVWDRVRKRAQLIEVRIHDLRHSYASVAAAD